MATPIRSIIKNDQKYLNQKFQLAKIKPNLNETQIRALIRLKKKKNN